jgi:hypothetical protein
MQNKIFTLTITAKTKKERIKMAWEILTTGKVSHTLPKKDLQKEGIK